MHSFRFNIERHSRPKRKRGYCGLQCESRSLVLRAIILRANFRRAFTLVELLVVIAIIGVLVSLLLPAIQSARESARRSTCKNNLRQIGIGLNAYHEANKHFPQGGRFPVATYPGLSWGSMLLPYLEAKSTFESINPSVLYTDPLNLTAGQTVLPVFLCPTAPDETRLRKCAEPTPSPQEYAKNHYGGVNGEIDLRFPNAGNSPQRGAMIINEPISIKQITDGISHTIMIAEAPEGLHGYWIGVRNLLEQSTPINTPATFAPKFVFYGYGQEISSYHPGGAQTVFADASVHFLQETMDGRVLAALCSRAGGETISDF